MAAEVEPQGKGVRPRPVHEYGNCILEIVSCLVLGVDVRGHLYLSIVNLAFLRQDKFRVTAL